jgi:hypothetical protein
MVEADGSGSGEDGGGAVTEAMRDSKLLIEMEKPGIRIAEKSGGEAERAVQESEVKEFKWKSRAQGEPLASTQCKPFVGLRVKEGSARAAGYRAARFAA